MRNSIEKLMWQDKESTAQSVARHLMSRGVSPKEITSEHIISLYAATKKINTAPDFASIGGILPNQRIATINEHPLFAIIVETRNHPSLDFVVKNLIRNAKIPIQIFHGKDNFDFIMSTTIAKQVHDGNVHLTQLNTNIISANQYNALFLSKVFWDNVLGRNKILVFQTDAIICSCSEYTINDFISYDYIGSKWPRQRPVGLTIDGGNGGLSLRDWEKTYDCLDRFQPKYWTGGEDGYFAFHIDLMGGKVGRNDECAKFSTQYEFLFKSWGAHNITCLNNEDKTAFLNYCEEAKFMLDIIEKSNTSTFS